MNTLKDVIELSKKEVGSIIDKALENPIFETISSLSLTITDEKDFRLMNDYVVKRYFYDRFDRGWPCKINHVNIMPQTHRVFIIFDPAEMSKLLKKYEEEKAKEQDELDSKTFTQTGTSIVISP